MITGEEALRMLTDAGVILTESHFVFSNWEHGDAYIDKDRILNADPRASFLLAGGIAALLAPSEPEVIVGPELGGVSLAMLVGYHLSSMREKAIAVAFAEKVEDGRSYKLRNGHDELVRGKRAAIVEDVINSGNTVGKIIEAIRPYVSRIVSVGALCDRNTVPHREIGGIRPIQSLVHISLHRYENRRPCPLCIRGVPIDTRVGRGQAYLEQQARNARSLGMR